MELAAGGRGERYGVGIDGNIVTASIKALLSGVNRLHAGGTRRQAA
jgi:2-isopropylmalate synthase